jgi:pyruvate-formate lyase-activating enzyme
VYIPVNRCGTNVEDVVIGRNGCEFFEDETIGYAITSRDLFAELRKEEVFMNESGGGITFSGGELLQSGFLIEMPKYRNRIY